MAWVLLVAFDDPRNGYFFACMGSKGLPFLREMRDDYVARTKKPFADIPDDETCRTLCCRSTFGGIDS